MNIFFIAVAGLLMIIIPQLITLWWKYLLYENRPLTSYANFPNAHVLYEVTVRAGQIHRKWDNYRIRRHKKRSTALGVILVVLAFILSFDCRPDYFFLTIYSIICGLGWLLVEYKLMSHCFNHFRFDKSKLVLIAIFGPFIIYGVTGILTWGTLRMMQALGLNLFYIDRYFTF